MVKLDIKFTLGNLCVDIGLWSPKLKQFKEVTAIFDTGAHTTHIDTGVLRRLGYNLDDAAAGYISTVGSNNMPINNTIIDNIQINDFEIGPVFVNFSDISAVNCLMVFGLNIIKEFNVTLDFNNMKMLLEPNFDVNSTITVERFNKSSSRFGMWVINNDEV